MSNIRIALLASAFAALPLTAALADRDPSPEERQIISDALRYEGFTGWGKIEFDDGQWEVDNAIGPDGRKYDLKLDRDFRVVDSERD